MSGHSKWSTIKRKKAAVDAKRGKVFTRLLKEIQIAAKLGGSNIDGNPRLKSAVQTAKSQSVPADNIDRAINRGTGDLEGVDYEEILYEGYGPAGVAVLVKVLTDNKNRTVAEVRRGFTKFHGSLGTSNSVAYLFEEKAAFEFSKSAIKEDSLFEVALDAGAEDIKEEDGFWNVMAPADSFGTIRDALEKAGVEAEGAIRMIPLTTVNVSGSDAEELLKLLDYLDDLDDVQSVESNFDMDEQEMSRVSGE